MSHKSERKREREKRERERRERGNGLGWVAMVSVHECTMYYGQ